MKKIIAIILLIVVYDMGVSYSQYSQSIISTIAGTPGTAGYTGDTGPATSAQLNQPYDIAFDASGNYYIADYGNNVVRKVSTSGIITTIAGTGTAGYGGDTGPATSALLSSPCGITIDASGNIYVSEEGNHVVRKINTSGIITTVAGNYAAGAGYNGDGIAANSAQLNHPRGITIDGSGNLYIADIDNYRIRKVSTGGTITTIAGVGYYGTGGDPQPATSAPLGAPYDVSVDASGNIYIADLGSGSIRKVNTSGTISTVVSIGGYPVAVTTDNAGNLYVSSYYGNAVLKVNSSGIASTLAGNGTNGHSGDGGPAPAANIGNPAGVVVDGSGNIYFCEVDQNIIRKVSFCHTVSVNSATINCSQAVTLSATCATSFVWSTGATTSSIRVNPTTTTSYTVTGTDDNGNQLSAVSVVTVVPLPTVSVNAATICKGSSATLTATGASTYTWSPTASLNTSTGATVIATPTVTTTYTIAYANPTLGCELVYDGDFEQYIVPPAPQIVLDTAPKIGFKYSANPSGSSLIMPPPYSLPGSNPGPDNGNVYMPYIAQDSTIWENNPLIAITPNTNYRFSFWVNQNNSPQAFQVKINNTAITTFSTSLTSTWVQFSTVWNSSSATQADIKLISSGGSTGYTLFDDFSFRPMYTTTTTTVTVNALPTLTISPTSPTICAGSTATLTATGATSYSWSTGASTTFITVTPGTTTTYTVTGTNASGCTNKSTGTVTVITVPTVTVSANLSTICSGSSATLTASGASSYTWTPSAGLSATTGASVTASPTVTTTYSVTGTNSCGSNTKTVIINVNLSPTVTVTANPATICAGSTATLTAAGATSYSWSTGATTASIPVTLGTTTTYTVTGTGTNGCTNKKTSTITVITVPTVTVSASLSTICLGSSATLTASGALSYTWTPSAGLSATTGASVIASPTVTTTYSVTGTNTCGTNTKTINITVNALPTISVTANPATICAGVTATLTASGGVSYVWNTGSSVNPLPVTPGTTTSYTVTGTDNKGCKNTTTTTITVNPLPTVSVTATSLTICAGATTTLTASGGISYIWSTVGSTGGATTASIPCTPSSTTTYTVIGTGSNGCSKAATITVTVNPLPLVTITPLTSSICIGSSTTLTAGGASTYVWNTLVTTTTITVSPTTATNFTVMGTDNNGCSANKIATVGVNPLPVITANPATICNGSTAVLTAGGASTYVWSTGASVNPLSVSPGTTTSYTVTGTDNNGCKNTTTTTVTVNPLPTVSVTATSLTICAGATTTLTANGGISYVWSTSGTTVATTPSIPCTPSSTTTYTVIGTGANGCSKAVVITVTVNQLPLVTISPLTSSICIGSTTTLTAGGASTYIWNTSATTTSITVSPTTSTNYTVTGTDNNNCSANKIATVGVNPLPIITASTATICNGNTAVLTAGGASTYVWSTGASVNPLSVSPGTTTSYTVTGTDNKGCVGSTTTTVTVNTLPTVSVTANPATICAGATTTLTATGGVSYVWNTGSSVNPLPVTPGTTTTYTVTGTGANGCSKAVVITVTVNQLPLVTISPLTSSICIGSTTTLTAGGASTYVWNTLATTTSITVSPTTATNYTVAGTDNNGCSAKQIATVGVNPLPVITASTATICNGNTAVLTAGGASTYVWSTGASVNPVSVSPGSTTSYTVTGTDNNGCKGIKTTTVTVNPLPTVTITSSPTICAGTATTLTATGGVTYSWNTGATSTSITVTPGTTTNYLVTGTGANGCSKIAVATVTVKLLPVVTVNSASVCVFGTALLTANGATTYKWSTGATTNTITANPLFLTTSYTVTGTNSCGTNSAVSKVTVLYAPTVTVTSTTICKGTPGAITASGADTYSWVNASTLNSSVGQTVYASPAVNTTYTVTGSNMCGTGTAQSNVTVLIPPTTSVSPTVATMCLGATATTLTASGTATSFSWSPGAGLNTTTGTTVNATPSSTTTYFVTGSDGKCTSTAAATVNVIYLPVITVNPDIREICQGGSIQLTAGGAITYAWSPSTGLSGTTGAVVVASPTVTTTYTVTGQNTCGYGSLVITVKVKNFPVIQATAPTTICAGSSATLTATGTDLDVFTWSPKTALNTPYKAQVISTPGSSITYTVTGKNACGAATATTSVSVLFIPQISVGSDTICSGSSIALNTIGIGYIPNYNWSPPDGLSSVNTASVIATPTVTTTYTVIGSNMCGQSAATSTVTVVPPTLVNVNAATICQGASTTLNATGADVYVWSASTSGLSSYIRGDNVFASPVATTVYTVTGQSVVLGKEKIKNGDFSQGNSLFTSTYHNEEFQWWGNYYIGKGVFSHLQNGSIPDHTNKGDNMMASFDGMLSDNVMWEQVVDSLVPNQDYNFSFWATRGDVAQPYFEVHFIGDVSGDGVAGSEPGIPYTGTYPQWDKYSNVIWNSGSNTKVTIRIKDVNFAKKGNDFLVDDISLKPVILSCTKNVVTTTVTVNPLPSLTLTANPNTAVCPNTTVTLTASGATSYAWSSGANTSQTTVAPSQTTNYVVTGTSNKGCVNSSNINVSVIQITASSALICTGSSATLTASGGSNYHWSNGVSAASINVSPTVSTTYSVSGTNSCGTQTASGSVVVETAPPVVSVPTSFSVCPQLAATVDASNYAVISATGADSYSWATQIGLTAQTPNWSTVQAFPPATTTYTITGLNACGTGTATTQVVVNALPVLTVSSPTICPGDAATLVATGASSYTWTTTNGTTVSNTMTDYPTITTYYRVYGFQNCLNYTDGVAIVNPLPTVAAQPVNICTGATATLSATGNAVSYSWDSPSQIGNPVTYTPTVTTTYTVTGTSDKGCTKQVPVLVTVTSYTTITVASQTICQGDGVTLTASGAPSYVWNTGDITPSIYKTPTVTTTYTVNGGPNACVTAPATAQVYVALPVVSLTVSPQTICQYSTVTLTATGADSYEWNSLPVTVYTASITDNPNSSTLYSVIGYNGGPTGCSSQFIANVTVNPNLIVSVTSPTTICSGLSSTLNASGSTAYTWSSGIPGDPTPNTGASVTVSPLTSNTYTVTGTVSNGCSMTATTSVTVTTFTVTPSVSTICQGSSVTLTASGASSYTWSPGGATTPSIPVNTSTPGTFLYSVKGPVIGGGGCTPNIITTVTVNPLPVITFTTTAPVTGPTATIVATTASGPAVVTYDWWDNTAPLGFTTTTGNTYSVTVFGTFTVTGWTANGCESSSNASINTSGGVTTITSYTQAAFRSLQEEEAFSITSEPEAVAVEQTVLFPNPNNGNMTLRYSINENDRGSMIIYDLLGQLIASYTLDGSTNQLQITNEQLMSSGTYIYRVIVNESEIKHGKIIVVQ